MEVEVFIDYKTDSCSSPIITHTIAINGCKPICIKRVVCTNLNLIKEGMFMLKIEPFLITLPIFTIRIHTKENKAYMLESQLEQVLK